MPARNAFRESPAILARLNWIEMSDTLYLSLWYPNLRLEALPDKLTAVLGAFAAHGGERGVYAATVWPVSWSETPVFQRVWGRAGTTQGGSRESSRARQSKRPWNCSTTTTPTSSRSAGRSGNWKVRSRAAGGGESRPALGAPAAPGPRHRLRTALCRGHLRAGRAHPRRLRLRRSFPGRRGRARSADAPVTSKKIFASSWS